MIYFLPSLNLLWTKICEFIDIFTSSFTSFILTMGKICFDKKILINKVNLFFGLNIYKFQLTIKMVFWWYIMNKYPKDICVNSERYTFFINQVKFQPTEVVNYIQKVYLDMVVTGSITLYSKFKWITKARCLGNFRPGSCFINKVLSNKVL